MYRGDCDGSNDGAVLGVEDFAALYDVYDDVYVYQGYRMVHFAAA